MAISFDPTPVPPAIRGKDFSVSVSVAVPGTISSMTVSLIGGPEPITINVSGSSISLSGKYLSGWQDIFTYVEAGESDKTDTPKTAIDISNMPPDKNLYDLDQDKKQSIIRQYSVTVVYDDEETFVEETATANLDHEVFNDLEAMRQFMANYNYNGG
jgi:hypothetical protein